MPAVVRVKRRIDEEPLSAFVLNGKRRRLGDENGSTISNKEELSTLLKFAGTIKEQDDTATTQFARLSKEEAKELVLKKSHKPANATDKARHEMRQHQLEQRFRVVNCLRTTLDEDDTNTNSKEITIVDIEKHSANNKTAEISQPMTSATTDSSIVKPSTSAAAAAAAAVDLTMHDSDTNYVYDLYIPDNEQQADYVDLMDDNYLSIRAFDDLIYEDRYNSDDDDDEYDSEDSNQENYFGNEYPDEEDNSASDSDEDTNHLRKALKNFVLEDDDEENDAEAFNNSSSEDDDFYYAYRDPYVHSIDPEENGFCYDIDSCDIDRYGLAYAQYKARILKKIKCKADSKIEDDSSDADDEDNDYYHSADESKD